MCVGRGRHVTYRGTKIRMTAAFSLVEELEKHLEST
jgi:hypothetical protein